MSAPVTAVGIIGTGMLGGAVGLRLLDRPGVRLSAYNRTAEKARGLGDRGARVRASPRQVAEESDIVITVVRDADAVRRVSFGADGIAAGRHDGLAVADMSTINPLESKRISRRFREAGVEMLDIPVMGGPDAARAGGLVMMAAGDRRTFDRFRPVLDAVAGRVFYLGEGGTAHAVKLSMNLQIAMLALALSEGITFARGAGVRPEAFLEVLNATYFRTGMSQNKAFRMIRGEFDPTFTLANLRKDLRAAAEASGSFGITLPMLERAEEIYAAAVEDGLGGLDYTGILEKVGPAPDP